MELGRFPGVSGVSKQVNQSFRFRSKTPPPTPVPLSRQQGRVGATARAVDPREVLHGHSCSNRSRKAVCLKRLQSRDPGPVRFVHELGASRTSQGFSGLDAATFPLPGAPSFRRVYFFQYSFKLSKRYSVGQISACSFEWWS